MELELELDINNILNTYLKTLLEACLLPMPMPTQKTKEIDIVIDGGAFNGSYAFGCLCFLKELERRNKIKIKRISGSSVGSIIGFLYFIDTNNDSIIFENIYKVILTQFTKYKTLNLQKLFMSKEFQVLKDICIKNNICNKVNGKLFIAYHNIKTRRKIIKSKYKSLDDILNTIIKSCYIPIITDRNLCYKNKYVDGMTPYIFSQREKRKILYIDLFGADKIFNLLDVHNEKSSIHRIIHGINDCFTFYIKGCNTQMCSYVDEWGYFLWLKNKFKKIFEFIILMILNKIFMIFNYFN